MAIFQFKITLRNEKLDTVLNMKKKQMIVKIVVYFYKKLKEKKKDYKNY